MHCGQSSMRARAATRGGGDVVTDNISMDPKIWSSLENDLLSKIFGKLPFQEFFQLRVVCKAWNRLASDQKFLEASFTELTVPKPYFVVASHSRSHRVPRRGCIHDPAIPAQNSLLCHGLLSYDASSSRWNWTGLPLLDSGREGYSAMDGLIYSAGQVINLHTRVFHTLPPPPGPVDEFPYFGVTTLDRSQSPLTFQIVLGRDTDTFIYISRTNSWTQIETEDESDLHCPGTMSVTSCACCNGFMYFARSTFYAGVDVVMRYDLERRIWAMIRLGPEQCAPPHYPLGGKSDFFVGACEGQRLLGVALRRNGSIWRNWCTGVKVWELHTDHRSEHQWTEVASMPKDQCQWLTYASVELEFDHFSRFSVGCSFCGAYVLVYTWRDGGLLDQMRFVVCKLDTEDLTKSVWESVELHPLQKSRPL